MGEGSPDDRVVGVDLGVSGFREVREIGRGGFAIVYRAFQPAFDRLVAIKVLSVIMDATALARFERECRTIGALSDHPNIVTVHGAGRTPDGRPFIVMELLEESLAERLKREGPLPWWEVADIGVKLAGALESAHQAGVLHRDVKPDNVITSRFREPKLADFGIARVEGQRLTRTGTIIATWAHAPPEVLEREQPTVASDVYSLASTLFELVAGLPAFVHSEDENEVAVLARVPTDPVPDLRPRGVPDALLRVLERGMAKDPSHRPASAAVFGQELQQAQAKLRRPVTPMPIERTGAPESEQVPAPPQPSPPTPPAPANETPATRGTGQWIAGGAAVAVLALIAGLVVWRGTTEDPTPPPTTAAPTTVGSAISTTTSPTIPPANILFRDDFSTPRWMQVDDERATQDYVDGQYRILFKSLNVSRTQSAPGSGTQSRARIDVDATKTSSAVGSFGVFCRSAGSSRYVGRIDTTGFWAITRYDGSDIKELTRAATVAMYSPAINASGPNRLTFQCTGEATGSPVSLRLEVNGTKVAEVQDPAGLAPGSFGLYIASGAERIEVRFDNFVASLP